MPSIILKITTDTGIVGYGEAVPDEHVTGESWESTYAVLKHQLVPAIIGENPMAFEKLHDKMNHIVKDVPAAKAAIDIACFDIAGKALQVPVYQLLGGRYRLEIPDYPRVKYWHS
ncbi:Dipeptide epimerase OS=Lysinibacillus sphaericus OX=1421 GN=LS41612_20920 PE=3 SV=1 [Lysinibacillus sphaericus]